MTSDLAGRVLRRLARDGDELARHEGAPGALAEALARHSTAGPEVLDDLAATATGDAREVLADLAAAVRVGAAPADRAVAVAVWLAEVRPALEAEARRRRDRAPALSLEVLTEIRSVLRPGLRVDGEHLADGDGVAVAGLDLGPRAKVPVADLAVVDAVLEATAGDLGRVAAYRLLWWIVREAHERAEAMPSDAVPRLRVDGGWGALCEAIGVAPDWKTRDLVKRVAIVLDRVVCEWPDGICGRLYSLAYSDRRTARGRRNWITITPEPPLLPQYAPGIADRRRRKLVPWPDLPPLVGRPRDHGAQCALALSVLAELRLHARECATSGGVALPRSRWRELADAVGCPHPAADAARVAWAGPWLERVDGDRFTLADPDARAFLEAGGRIEEAAARGGRARARKKHHRRGKRR